MRRKSSTTRRIYFWALELKLQLYFSLVGFVSLGLHSFLFDHRSPTHTSVATNIRFAERGVLFPLFHPCIAANSRIPTKHSLAELSGVGCHSVFADKTASVTSDFHLQYGAARLRMLVGVFMSVDGRLPRSAASVFGVTVSRDRRHETQPSELGEPEFGRGHSLAG